jgi:UDP-glucose 4-epimerase
MLEVGINKLIFSSFNTVYDMNANTQIRENFPLMPTNPYERSKPMAEPIYRDFAASDSQ